ncbi:PAS domain-containing protein [Shewanella marina]|uniref:PAS domain-containing protein n=1 Tax=Shewanella marina TaxID=487319 RepID=UPI00047180F7|nr:PAS domain-containing protein [Shewanella marina]
MKFKDRILLIQSIAAILIAVFCVLITFVAIDSVITNDKFHETRNIATAIAMNPEIEFATKESNRKLLDNILRKQQYHLELGFVVIAGKDGQRLFHTDPNKEGGFIQDHNFTDVANGKVITTIRRGLSGVTINTRMPIYYHNTIVGVVSVGFLQNHVQNLIHLYLFQASSIIILMLLVMIYCSKRFSNYIQQQLSGMSPTQISQAYQLRKGILNSVAEGVIAVDINGIIMVINKRAVEILGIEQPKESLFGQPISTYCYPSEFFTPELGDVVNETTINLNGETLIASRTMMKDNDDIIGYVVSFRCRNAAAMLELMANQIAKERDNLRATTHEYANNVAVVSGMLEMGLFDKAIQFIHKESHALQEDISGITAHFHPLIAALIISKKHRAHELGFSIAIIEAHR